MRRVLIVSTILGLLLGGLMMYVAWQHNSQGEFHDSTGIHWRTWIPLGVLWALVPFSVGALWALMLRLTHGRS